MQSGKGKVQVSRVNKWVYLSPIKHQRRKQSLKKWLHFCVLIKVKQKLASHKSKRNKVCSNCILLALINPQQSHLIYCAELIDIERVPLTELTVWWCYTIVQADCSVRRLPSSGWLGCLTLCASGSLIFWHLWELSLWSEKELSRETAHLQLTTQPIWVLPNQRLKFPIKKLPNKQWVIPKCNLQRLKSQTTTISNKSYSNNELLKERTILNN